jgi:hypothetical protein
MEVFINYSTKDILKAQALSTLLDRDGYSVWRDQDRLRAGGRFTIELERALLRADVVISLVSKNAKESPWVENEILFALDHSKPIIPIMLEPEIGLPLSLYGKQHIGIFKDWNLGYEKLNAELKKLAEIQQAPSSTLTIEVPVTTLQEPQLDIDVDPFLYGSAVSENFFLGRASVLNEIRSRVATVDLQSISIVGNRRMGKTSLLRYVTNRCQYILPTQYQWVAAYIDMMGARAHTLRDVMRILRRAISRQLKRDPWAEHDDGNLSVLEEIIEEIAESKIRVVI